MQKNSEEIRKCHREIKGRFRKRVVLANVPSFRFSFRGNMRTHPRSGFRSGGTSAKTTLLETTLLGSSESGPKVTTFVLFRYSFRVSGSPTGVVRLLLGTGPPDPTPESASPSPAQGSIWHPNRVKIRKSISNRCWIDTKSTPEEGRARQIRGWGPGGLCLKATSQNWGED